MGKTSNPRRVQAVLSSYGVTFLHGKNPYMVAWWSAAFPGYGHFLLNQYARGFVLTLSEVITNTMARVNETLVYSFSGQFELAKQTLEIRWALGYMIVYMFCIWDSFINAQSMNKLYALAQMENARIRPYTISPNEIQYLERRSPYVAALFSLVFPGLGQLYNHRIALAFYAMIWWWIYLSLSNAHVSLHLHFYGSLDEAVEALRTHWLLFMPSVTGGSVYHAFVTTIEHNRLFRVEMSQYLKERYGESDICIMPS